MSTASVILTGVFGVIAVYAATPSHICVKEETEVKARVPIKTDAIDFKDLVKHSMVFVDKTFLLKYIMEEESLVSFTYPRKWGKTINLDMMKVFVEQEVDTNGTRKAVNETWSYKFFVHGQIQMNSGKIEKLRSRPMIAAHKNVINKYVGKFPAVFLRLSRISKRKSTFSSFDDFMDCFKIVIGELFEEHKYLIRVLENNQQLNYTSEEIAEALNKFNRLKSGTAATTNETVYSIDFLTKLQNEVYNTRSIVFIDDYDAIMKTCYINSASHLSSEEADKIVDFYYLFIRKTIEANPYLEKGFVSGELHLATYPMSSIMHYLTKFSILRKNLPPFYGFTRAEVDELLSFFHIPANITETALENYCGYEYIDVPKKSIYNPWSIVNLANTGQIEPYWSKTGNFNVFPHALFHKNIREPFETLISRSSDPKLYRNRQFSFDRFDFQTMRDLVLLKDVSQFQYNEYTLDLLLHYYYMTGYLTLKSDLENDNYTVEVPIRIPNREIQGVIVSEMANIYKHILGKTMIEAARKASRSLIQCTDEQNDLYYNSSAVQKDLDLLRSYSTNPSIVDNKTIPYYGDPLHNAHFMILLFLRLDGYDIGFDILHFGSKKTQEMPFIHV